MRAILVLLVVLTANVVGAQDYQSIIAEAVRENSDGHYPEAYVLFQQAHELNPNARTLRALGAVSYELREYARSILVTRQALVDERRPLTIEQRAEAEALIERAHRFVGRYEVQVEGVEDYTLTLDDSPVEAPLVLAIGSHTVVVSATEDRSQRQTIHVAGGESETLEFNLSPEELPEPITIPVVEAPSHIGSTIAFIAAGVGVGLYAIAGGLGLGEKNELDKECGDGSCPEGRQDTLQTFARLADSGLAIAAVGLTIGLILRFVVEKEQPAVEVSATRNSGAVYYRRRF